MAITLKEFFKNFADVVKNLISRYEKEYKHLSGAEKKARLDDAIENYAMTVVDNIGANFILKFALKKILISNIPAITQIIFDLIQSKVEGITKV